MDIINEEDFGTFSKVIREVQDIPFQTYDAEFVLENGQVSFTDLTVQSPADIELMEEINARKKSTNVDVVKMV